MIIVRSERHHAMAENTINSRNENTPSKKDLFFENAAFLYDVFGIVPLMYGSLGLEFLTGADLNADDVDILVPKEFIFEKWCDFKDVLEKNGYKLIDAHEHEFEKDGIHYAYAQIEDLTPFAGIAMEEIETSSEGDVRFKLLNLQQYLKVYSASSLDGYRANVKEKKDAEKIALIKSIIHAV